MTKLTKMTENVNIISGLDNYPPDDEGMTPEKLKALFDKGSNTIKDYLNNTLTEEIDPFLGMEAERMLAEDGRATAEETRVSNETARQNAEGDETKGRVKAELDRVAAEAARVLSEGDENSGRVKAEADRVTAEIARVAAEGDATKGRVKAENERVAAETARALAEGDATKGRVKAENERVLAETARANAEGDATKGRIKAELDRVSAESARVVRDIARGVWENYNPDKTYNMGNKVAYQGSSYYCVENLTKGLTPPDNPTRWTLISAKGDTGEVTLAQLELAVSDGIENAIVSSVTVSPTPPNKGLWLEVI